MSQELLAQGEFGRIQFLKGAHYQDMEGWPAYWLGLPPMHYATHAVSPVLALAGTRAKSVHCFGSGTMRAELRRPYGNPYPVETAIFELEGLPLAAEISRSLFQTARGYTESFNIYGEKLTFEWEQVEGEPPVVFKMPRGSDQASGRGSTITVERVEAPDRRTCCRPRSRASPARGITTRPTRTSRSYRAAGTAVLTRTWCTNLSAASSKDVRPQSTPCASPIGPRRGSAPTSRR